MISEEGEDVVNNIKDFSNEEKNMTNCTKFVVTNKRPIKKSVKIALDNKESIKEAVEGSNENIKKITNFALDHENFTKDVVDLTLDEGEKVVSSIEDFQNGDQDIMSYVKLTADNKIPIQKSVDVLFENKRTTEEIIDREIGDDTLRGIAKFALENENLTKAVVNTTLNVAEYVNDECKII